MTALQTLKAWNDRGAMLPETIKPAEFRKEINSAFSSTRTSSRPQKIAVDQ